MYPKEVQVVKYIQDVGIHPLKINQGSTFKAIITLYQDDIPWNLTNFSVRGNIKASSTQQENLSFFVCNIIDPVEGKIRISLPISESTNILTGNTLTNMCSECWSLLEVSDINAPLATMSAGMFNNCFSLNRDIHFCFFYEQQHSIIRMPIVAGNTHIGFQWS